MKDEIKEILDEFNNKDIYWRENGYLHTTINYDEMKLLLDYITNLQNRITELEEINKQHQELNGELRERCEYLQRSCDRKEEQRDDARMEYMLQEDYKERCEKAIDCLSAYKYGKNWINDELVDSAFNILQDKEEV